MKKKTKTKRITIQAWAVLDIRDNSLVCTLLEKRESSVYCGSGGFVTGYNAKLIPCAITYKI